MTFPIPRPKAQPGPAKAPIRYVRGGTFEVTTQAIFGRKRMPAIHIENAAQGRASADRRWAIQRGGAVMKYLRFLASCIRLRSFSRAVWVFRMDNHKPKF